MAGLRRVTGTLTACVLAAVLAGCSSPPPAPSEFVGKTLEQSQDGLPGPFIIIDLTQNVTGQPPSYNDGKDPSGWSVLTACKAASGEGYVVGVIPKSDASSAIITSARQGKYGSYVRGCK